MVFVWGLTRRYPLLNSLETRFSEFGPVLEGHSIIIVRYTLLQRQGHRLIGRGIDP